MKTPCTKCSKLISHGYGSFLSGIFVCKSCFDKSPKLQARLAARSLGAKGGAVKSEAKAEAARENGKLGGRPRKARGKAYGVDK